MNSNDSSPVEVPLSKGGFAKVDSDDYALVIAHRWHAVRSGASTYAATNIPREGGGFKTLYMHRLIAGQDGRLVDHRNSDGLDNTRKNLRPCDYTQNNLNRPSPSRSLPKGVYPQSNGFVVKAVVRKQRHYLGFFATLESAIEAAKSLPGVYGQDREFLPTNEGAMA
jgi:hypothetical protein